MFDISFSELALLAVVGLLVLGPERLPGTARKVGEWVAWARRYSRGIQANLERQFQEEVDADLQEIQREVRFLSEVADSGTTQAGFTGQNDAPRQASGAPNMGDGVAYRRNHRRIQLRRLARRTPLKKQR